ncbi:hypothetical protein QO206_03280 [Leeuwenhoekiella aequorea]|uniref:hypothetical protein n=1 Tax=Leeuwenhoekiella aequorea TaxID=283736 RepID=UPI00352C731E|tara:strand:+ start:10356 stop:10580 length:225 start_codon:yes stop_codon:yes gene_type:complete
MADCKHKWVYDYTGSYAKPDGRNSMKYYKADHFHCEKCLEQKVVETRHSGFDHEEWNAPEWVQVLVKGKITQNQ